MSEQFFNNQADEQVSILEVQRSAEKVYCAHRDAFRNVLRSRGIWKARYADALAENADRKDISDEERSEADAMIRQGFHGLALEAMQDDANLYEGIQLLEEIGDIEPIRARINQGYRMNIGELNYDLAFATLHYGTDQQIEVMIKDWLKERGQTNLAEFEETRYFKERLSIINDSFNAFAKAHGLPEALPDMDAGGAQSSLINAATELKKKKYDVAIGILNSGVYVAELLDYLGQNTRYVEWHRHWTRQPIWKHIGSNDEPIENAQRILLCEQDIHTGATMDNLEPFLRELQPEQVDATFWIDMHNKVKHFFDGSEFYGDAYMLRDIPTDNLIENLNAAVAYAKQDKTRELIA